MEPRGVHIALDEMTWLCPGYVDFLRHSSQRLQSWVVDVPPWSNFGAMLQIGLAEHDAMQNLTVLHIGQMECLGWWPATIQAGSQYLWRKLLPQLEVLTFTVGPNPVSWQTLKDAILDPNEAPAARLARLSLFVKRDTRVLDAWLYAALRNHRLPALRTVELRTCPLSEDAFAPEAMKEYVEEMQCLFTAFGIHVVAFCDL